MPAQHKLTDNFGGFFKRLNPSPTYVRTAASAQSEIRSLIESAQGPAGDLRVKSFIQGSYGRHTAIYTINDVDIVALCSVSHRPTANRNTRNHIFSMIADSISADDRYKDKLRYTDQSVCVKVELAGVKVEVLPALRTRGARFEHEPFWIFRPGSDPGSAEEWVQTYARRHQVLLSEKNGRTADLFVPIVKVIKHLRSASSQIDTRDAASYHLESLLYAIRDPVYAGSVCECTEQVLQAVAGFDAEKAAESGIRTPCGEKILFSPEEWALASYARFNEAANRWFELARQANAAVDRDEAVDLWKLLLGDGFFPRDPE